jgi:hypothetical protein
MADGVQGYKGAQVGSPASHPMASVVKRSGLLRHCKGIGKLCLLSSPTPRASRQLHQ